ncbi:MAG: hypothetical protein SF172_04540 [Burkholderiales bacterium]|nr:hypothetical protein [Burkholderiales bacterium]
MSTDALAEFDNKLLDGLEFCARTYALFERIRADEDGKSRLRTRVTEVEKKLLEELLPICKYIQSSYRVGRYISVRWVRGSQQFDAEVLQMGAYVQNGYFPAASYLEVTCVMHPNDYLMRELLDKEGAAFGLNGIRRLPDRTIDSKPIACLNRDFIVEYSKLVLKQLGKKAGIPYPDETTLVVQCTLDRLYFSDEWDEMVSNVRSNMPANGFREIFMYDLVQERICVL